MLMFGTTQKGQRRVVRIPLEINNKKSDKSPDFVCSTNDPAICGGHTGKWRKSWWMDNSDLPEEWGLSNEL